MVAPTQLQVSSHRSLHDVVYRLIDTAMILSTTYLAMSYSPHLELANLLVVAAATLIVFMFATEVSGLYRSWRSARLSAEAWCVAISWIYTAPVVLGVGMLTQYNAEFNYLTKVFWLLATPLAVAVARLAFRTFLRALRRRGINTQRFAICGANKLGVQLAQNVRQSPELGMALAGYFDDRSEGRTQQESGSVPQHVGNLDRLVELARSGEIGTIFITFPMRAEDRIRTVLDQLSDTTASVYIVPDFFVFEMLHARWNQINGLPVVSIFETPIIGIDGMLKRGFDFVVASLLLALLAVPMTVIALLVKLSSRGPVFFRQKRYGLSGEEIGVLKFRSMRCCDNGPTVRQATKDDDRITPIGRILRKTSLDELPQLFNVIGGSMSLVGPRPHASAHNEQYRSLIDGYMLRHKVKPGITGLAQVNGWRGETETLEKMERRVEFDHRYISEWSLGMDLRILLQTVGVVFKCENAY